MSQEWKMVPLVPTKEMMLNGSGCKHHDHDDLTCIQRDMRSGIWAKMLAAAPVTPVGGKIEVFGYWTYPNFAPEHGVFHRDILESTREHCEVVELVDRAHVTRLNAEVSALQQRLNTADQRASDLTWLAKAAYMEGWELGWVSRHSDANNEKRVTPWAPPREVMEREWLASEGRAALNQPAPAEDVHAVVEKPADLREFANDMISAAYEGGSFDGGDIQDIAVKHGLLRIEKRVEACGEHCACSGYGFPAECYRRADILKAPQ